MRTFHCDHCGNAIFFENTRCKSCGHVLAFLPDQGVIGSLEPLADGLWRSPIKQNPQDYRLCTNYTDHDVCNWALDASEPSGLCPSCKFTLVIPDLSLKENQLAWYRLEVAKRRLLYSLKALGLPIKPRYEGHVDGLAFQFLADSEPNSGQVLTGHQNGIITLNIAEADDAERERRRQMLGEPYRTILGHFRHEIGHYYWDMLIRDSNEIDSFRALFGDERADYNEALRRNYEQGPVLEWNLRFVTAYASCHPWEDWAETWSHYMHMTDAIDTAAACGLSLQPRRKDEPKIDAKSIARAGKLQSFDEIIDNWVPLTYVLNNFSRSLGMPDAYPFALPNATIDKLAFVHETIRRAATDQDAGDVSAAKSAVGITRGAGNTEKDANNTTAEPAMPGNA